jgi:carboxylesterase
MRNERLGSAMTPPPIEPFWLPGGACGCLLIHGFAGTPAEMRGLGDHLHAQGHTVCGVRLQGHGGDPAALRGIGWRAWLASAEAGLTRLRARCSTVVVVGFSLGGALAALLTQAYAFERLALLATPLRLAGDWRLHLLPVLRYAVPWFYPLKDADLSDPFIEQRIREFAPDADLSDPQVCDEIRNSVRIPLGAIDEMQKALRQARARLPRVQMPVLVMQGRNDEVIPADSADDVMRRLGSRDKQLVWWEHTTHQMLVVGPHREAIYARVADFVGPALPAK